MRHELAPAAPALLPRLPLLPLLLMLPLDVLAGMTGPARKEPGCKGPGRQSRTAAQLPLNSLRSRSRS
ncbi:hypothetical protein [Massilia sp. X63]|uniref:hypothetical protein n=1 Tax=Massilia sp. X63 TaxID=3237285 RepID=UPI0034DD02AB